MSAGKSEWRKRKQSIGLQLPLGGVGGRGRSSGGRASDRHAADAGSIPRCGKAGNFQCRLSYGASAPPCAIAYINICAHDKGLIVRQCLVDYGNTKTPGINRRLGSVTPS